MSHSIGIDLGTTNSAVAFVDQYGVPQMVKDSSGDTTTPSAIYFMSPLEIIVGKEAKEALAFEPENVAMFFKRNMGSAAFFPSYQGRSYDATALSTEMLKYLGQIAKDQLGNIGDVIITVPAYFHNPQREATIEAGKAAGLNVIRTINEPTAAAVAYSQRHPDIKGKFLVYDLGGGTFDVTILEYTAETTRVIASDGNHLLGGILWDERLLKYVTDAFADEHNLQPMEDPNQVGELRLLCEGAKKALSAKNEAKVSINFKGCKSNVSITRDVFEDFTRDLTDQTRTLMMQVLRAAGLRWPDLDATLLVGGSTRMPAVRTMLATLARKEPLVDINPDECVAIGAALEAARTSDRSDKMLRLGSVAQTRTTQDVTPHSLGYVAISPQGTRFINDIVLPRNKPIPIVQSNQAELETKVGDANSLDLFLLQGEQERVLNNEVLGHYEVTNVPHYKGKTRLEIGFHYDESGVVQVTCKDITSGTDLSVRVTDANVDLSWTEMSPEEYARKMLRATAVLLIDTSSSMGGIGIREAMKGAHEFLAKLPSGGHVKVALVEFGCSNGGVLHPLSTDYSSVGRTIGFLTASGGTPLTEGLVSCELLMSEPRDKCTIVVLTDGAPNNRDSALKVADQLKKSGVRIIAVGAGSGVDYDFLRQLASNHKDGMAVDFNDVANTFGRIAKALGSSTTGGINLKGLKK